MKKQIPITRANAVEEGGGAGRGGDGGEPSQGAWQRFKELLASPVNGASLAMFRMAVGFVMFLEAYSICQPSASVNGSTALKTYYAGSDIHFSFPYEGFEWLPLWPANWITVLVWALGIAGLLMAAGFLYRASAAVVFLVWGYFYAIESTRTYWMSYYYLELLATFLMIWMPAARRYSVDAWLARNREGPRTVPDWTIVLLRGQLVIAYFYAGVAKLNTDWMLDAMPVRWFLEKPHVAARLQHLFGPGSAEAVKNLVHSPALAYFISWVGAVFDLAAGFLLLNRRTRMFGMILMLIFHGINHFILFTDIVWFPLVGVTTALIFLDTDWPERFWKWIRRPRFARPDWGWFLAGLLTVPGVGAALGWKLAPTPRPRRQNLFQLSAVTVPLVLFWLAWQALMPLRHYLIPGDARFTFEGLRWSWRLKADYYRSEPCEVTVVDPAIVSTNTTTIYWTNWLGDPVLYRRITPGRLDWSMLPEVVVLLEPLIGERILFNPYAGVETPRTEQQSRERVNQIWRETYDRPPQRVNPTVRIDDILTGYAKALSKRGQPVPESRNILTSLNELHGRSGTGELVPVLRRMTPFALLGEPVRPAPFLVIEDPVLIHGPMTSVLRVDRKAWRNSPQTRAQRGPPHQHVGVEPMIIYQGNLGSEVREEMPQYALMDSQDDFNRPPWIWWNYLKELNLSKGMHISTYPFLMRRYARRIADRWQHDYGRRPAVRASTGLSLNGRPSQPVVDPAADLASVPTKFFGRNPWILDLKTPRIPKEALTSKGD